MEIGGTAPSDCRGVTPSMMTLLASHRLPCTDGAASATVLVLAKGAPSICVELSAGDPVCDGTDVCGGLGSLCPRGVDCKLDILLGGPRASMLTVSIFRPTEESGDAC